MDFIKELNKSISQPPSFIQVAIKGIWEDAWYIPFEKGVPSIKAINQYLEKGTEEIAIEVFFKTEEGYNIILGVRFKEQLLTATPKDFLVTSFHSIWSVKPPTLASIISNLSKKLTGDAKALFGIDPTEVELGVVNHWKSMGNIKIWDSTQDKKLNRETLKKQLEENPHLLQNSNNYIAMEFNYRVSPHYWLGIQVADKHERNWVLNNSRLEHLLKKFLDIFVR